MIRIAILGTGLIGARHVITALAHPGITVAATVDPARPGHPGIPHSATLDDVTEQIDAAIIATPTATHAQLGAICAKRGWAVLVEKPIAGTEKDAESLIAACHTAGVPLMVGHHRRQHANIAKARDILHSGAIGTPVGVSAIWAVKKTVDYFKTEWRAAEDGSPIFINLVHDIDLLQYLLGPITELAPILSSAIRSGATEDTGAVALRFANGTLGTILFSDSAPSPWSFEAATSENPNIAGGGDDCYRFIGTEGALAYPSLTLWGDAADWSKRLTQSRETASATDPLHAQLDHLIDVVTNGATPICSGADGLATLRIARAIKEGTPWKS